MVTPSIVHIIIMLWPTITLAVSQPKPGCQETCGNVVIPYPFGIGAGCYLDNGFAVTCTNTSSPPKPFINSIDLEILEISLSEATVRVNYPVFSTNCVNKKQAGNLGMISLKATPFSFSATRNRFTAVGCDNLALIISLEGSTLGGCVSTCNSTRSESGCYGVNCCQTSIPPSLKYFNASLRSIDRDDDHLECRYAFLVEQEWLSYNITDAYAVRDMEYVPAVLDWAVRGTCDSLGNNGSTITNISIPTCSMNAYCNDTRRSIGHLCHCFEGYQGNPYLPEGCQDIDECLDPIRNICSDQAICRNQPGTYFCYMRPDNRREAKIIITGSTAGVVILCLLIIGISWMHKAVKRRKKKMLRKKFFKRNGGLILEQQLSSGDEGNVEKTKLFTAKELEKATDHYNKNRILGQGGQGTVYKGMLTDGRIIAVKKSKIVDENKLQEFINEVVILSQINHRNVVKLFGCCLETEVPMLVYEFIPKGTLYQHIHEKKEEEEFLLSWAVRLRVSKEVATALSYLHSSASIPIYHRDIKSSNILLDDKYQAKVSDFGTSRSMAVDKTHFTTKVQGTFGYLDPEYFQSSQFTEKSDVYSFGVVLVELFTGEKAISSLGTQEGRSLAISFINAMKENRLYDILDAQVVKEAGEEEIMAVANLALRCLNLNGKKRPTMKEVSMELEGIKRSQGETITKQNNKEVDYSTVTEIITTLWDDVSLSTSTGSCLENSVSSSSDVNPLLLNRS